MSTSQAIYAGWMEIPNSAEDGLARTQAEEATIAAMVTQYAGALYRVAYSVLRNPADAEDAVQEAFLRVLRHRDSLDEVRDRRVWLIRIVWNIDGLSAEQIASAAQYHAHVLACVEKLPAKERQVLHLSAFEELNSVEIAQVLRITESSVRSRLFRARNLMAELLNHSRALK
jgi:RNA polymerase sigma-70 factor (ECF subfamily)